VWRAGLLWHLWHKGVWGKLFRVLANMIDNTPCQVMHQGTLSCVVEPDLGWEQGDTLATTMFNVFIDSVLQHVWEHHPGVPIPSSAAAKLVALMHADDLVGTAANAPDRWARRPSVLRPRARLLLLLLLLVVVVLLLQGCGPTTRCMRPPHAAQPQARPCAPAGSCPCCAACCATCARH
jgi:hypothetical protein